MTDPADIETSILNALSSDTVLSGYVKAFEPLPSISIDEIRKVIFQTPAIGTIPGPGRYAPESQGKMDETGTFVVVAFNRNLRKRTASLRGDDNTPGCWEMLDEARRVLKDRESFDVSIIDCTPVSRDILVADKDGAVCVMNVEVKWRHSA